tara:strand:- start:663 stop:1031 length:369 start_codon:yes stop_codon:yes gene_type:complete
MGIAFNQIRVNDFVIVLKPVMRKLDTGKEAMWTGEVAIKLLTDLTKNTLNKYEFENISRISNLMAASIPAMHENKIVRHIIDYYLDNNAINLEHIDIEEVEEEVTDSNIIKLTFNSETEGNA